MVGSVNRGEYPTTIVGRSGDRTDLVHCPGQRHATRAGDSTESGPQPGHATSPRRRDNAAQCFAADGKWNQSRGDSGSRTGGGTAGSLPGIPRILSLSHEPLVAHRKRTHGQLGHQYCTSVFQPSSHRCRCVDVLIAKLGCSPGCRVPGHRDEVFCAPRNSVQRASILALSEFTIGLFRLSHCEILRQCDHAVEERINLHQPIQTMPSQFDRRDFLRPQTLTQFTNRQKRKTAGRLFNVLRVVSRLEPVGWCGGLQSTGRVRHFRIKTKRGQSVIRHRNGSNLSTVLLDLGECRLQTDPLLLRQ